MEVVSLAVQAAAVVVGVGAAVVALVLGGLDRRNAQKIAAEDRAFTARRQRLMFEIDAATRLAQNLRRGGSSDHEKSSDMGAEAGMLIHVLGAERLPLNWEGREEDDETLRSAMADPETLDWQRRGIEAQLLSNRLTRELWEEPEIDRATTRRG